MEAHSVIGLIKIIEMLPKDHQILIIKVRRKHGHVLKSSWTILSLVSLVEQKGNGDLRCRYVSSWKNQFISDGH